jgi:mono/diheme cytochrome c family protein
MMAASTLCSDSVEEARAIDEHLPDLAAYIKSLEAPAYPFEIDAALAASGREIFEDTCARCHGKYGGENEADAYPNLVVALEEVGTDPTLALGAALYSDEFLEWFNESFWGEAAQLEPAIGYIAPPLDGIWATAPYFHNASVPTVEAVIDPTQRPKYWTRSFNTSDYDPQALGFNYTELEQGKDGATSASERARIYDTTQVGYSNAGHDFGAEMSAEDRRALIEYLKTL